MTKWYPRLRQIISKRRKNKLNFDSEEEERREAEERAKEEEYRRRKEEKRLRREAEARRAEEEARKEREQEERYGNPTTMLEEDSDSGDSYVRIERKIRKEYP
jgi:membrane protein involved in colicin uptake